MTQHDKTHQKSPRNKNELLVSYERATLQLFNGENYIHHAFCLKVMDFESRKTMKH